jgi:hypothetical protein
VPEAALHDTDYLGDAGSSPKHVSLAIADGGEALLSLAVTALTAAAALSAPGGNGRKSEQLPYADDWADFVAHALRARPQRVRPARSWEAAHLRNLLEGTLGAEVQSLWAYRTDAINVTHYIRAAEDASHCRVLIA